MYPFAALFFSIWISICVAERLEVSLRESWWGGGACWRLDWTTKEWLMSSWLETCWSSCYSLDLTWKRFFFENSEESPTLRLGSPKECEPMDFNFSSVDEAFLIVFSSIDTFWSSSWTSGCSFTSGAPSMLFVIKGFFFLRLFGD